MYHGWKLMNQIYLYLHSRQSNGFLLGEIVDANAPKEIERMEGKYLEGVHFETALCENEGFICSILSSCMDKITCLFTKDTLQFQISFSLSNLFPLIESSVMDHGEIKEPVFFAKKEGRLFVMTKTMKEYEEAKQDMELKEKAKNRTVRFETGRNYFCLYEDMIYVGNLYLWYEQTDLNPFSGFPKDYEMRLLDEPMSHHFWIHTDTAMKLLDGENKLSVLVERMIGMYDGTIEVPEKTYPRFSMSIEKKKRPRAKGTIQLENDIDAKDLQRLWNAQLNYYRKKKETSGWNVPIEMFLYSAFSDIAPKTLTKEDKECFANANYQRYHFL